MTVAFDAVVVGSGPNGLAAAITLAAAGRSVVVLEANDRIGGGTRTAELTLPGFHHDVCSAFHPLGVASPFLRSLPLAEHGLRWLVPEVQLAHPFDDAPAALLHQSLDQTVDGLGAAGRRYRRFIGPIVRDWDNVVDAAMHPVARVPGHPLSLLRMGTRALPPATLVGRAFRDERCAALFAGNAAHSLLPLNRPLTASFGTILMAAAHRGGWPVAEGGSHAIAHAMAAHLQSLGGEIRTGVRVRRLRDLPPNRTVLFDTDATQMALIARNELPHRFRRRLRRFRNGPGAFKIDYALDGPMPWTDPTCAPAGTVHLGGTMAEIASAEADIGRGRMPDRPFVLVGQQSVIDPSRAPQGRHTLWAYAHVPFAHPFSAVEQIEQQIERFAPGFRDRVLARHTTSPAAFERYNPNYTGGDIAAGSHGGTQLFFRPTISRRPYATPDPRLWICSAASPPGAGVHGMCGHNAANAVLAGPLA